MTRNSTAIGLIEQWDAALQQAGGANPSTYEDYKPALLIVAKAMQAQVNPQYGYVWGDADRVLRQCDKLDNYPPWK